MADENIQHFENDEQPVVKNIKKKKRPPENTSGMGEKATIPAAVKKFNWGAFLFSFIWGLFNKTYITLLILLLGIIPVVNIGVLIWFGIKGNEWAWRNKRWNSVEHFNKVQKNWAIAGVL